MSLFRTMPTAGDFSPLFRLLDDYDNHRSSRGQVSHSVRSFTPRFDVRETSDAYHLDGELPGIPQDKIDIEFTDPQTLVIKGRSERESHSSNVNENTTANPEQAQAEAEKAAEGESTEVTTTNNKSVKATKQPKPRYWVSERSIGEIQRTFEFPTRVAQDDVKASLKDGVLSLVVPKAAAPTARKITIQ
ncbi:Hsp20/alpha crystallin family protein [Aspergillus stella-maris]|uniref:Hsp20/alpha crystallin family protein n=1 Tax=Aspergillus stella-maris TaxID=1810926 RepID=UPI003CCCF960